MLGTITITVGQRETPNVILKEESAENMESKPLESTDKTNVDDEQKDTQDGDKQLPSPEEKAEEQGQPSESPSNDVGFKKVFKFVGFKFSVRKEKTEKSESVQLLNVKSDDTEVASDGAGDHKEVKTEEVEETVPSEVPHPAEKTEQETQTEQMKKETSPEEAAESPVELPEGHKEAEVKSNGNKSPESPTSPLTNETASPLRKFFTQGWAGFRKKTSFRKPKEEEQQAVEPEKQEQEEQQEKVAQEEKAAIKEELEKEKVPEKDAPEVFVEPSEEKVQKDVKEREELMLVDASTETLQEEVVTPVEQQSPLTSTESVNKESEACLNEKTDLAFEEKLEPVQECQLEQSTSSEKTNEVAAPLAAEELDEKLDKSEPSFPVPGEEHEKSIEIVEQKPKRKAPLATESFDEIPTGINADVSTVLKKEDAKMSENELAVEQVVEADAEIQTGQATDEQLTVKETAHEGVNEQIKQIEPSSGDAAISKPPEGITNEVEVFSSHERAKMQGSPLKKLFTSTGLKKLSGKKHKGKREEAKSEEVAEQIQQLSDSAESPEEPKGESSASSPEETIESVEKVIDPGQIPETEEGSTSDMEKKGVTPWASFKKMVTPKKRVRRLSESDKEEELDKVKSATLSSTESAPYEEQEDMKENGEEQKLEKSTEEPKRKVDTSVSWEALICVGSSKKRARKSSSSDEEVGQRLAQEGQKVDEGGPNKETALDMPLTSSHESDQGQGSSSPEQAGSPSEGDGVSTWESFKRLVTPRRKSKTKMEERNEESVTVPALEHSTSDGDSGKEESWVSFKKLMTGRRKKKSDGRPEHTPVEEAGEEMTETTEEDSDVPAVVPLSEYEAAEQEKFEAQQAKEDDLTKKKTLDQRTERSEGTSIIEQSNEGLVHAVTVTVVEGERAVTSIEERSPSWISAAVTESIEHADEDEEKKIDQISETGIVEEAVTKLMPEIKKDISNDTILSDMELTSEAITAREETSGVEEATEVSCAEETEMVSAVSRLTESPDTTEIATPVQEVEESQPNLEELNKHTQEVLQEVAERVKLSDGQAISKDLSVEKAGEEITVSFQKVELTESSLKEEPEKTGIESKEGQSQGEVKESGLKEALEKSDDMCVDVKGSSKETVGLDWADKNKMKQEVVEIDEEITEEKYEEEEFVIVTVTSEVEPEVKVGDIAGKQQMSLEAKGSERDSADIVHEVKMSVKETIQGGDIEDGVSEVSESVKVTCEEKSQLPQKRAQVSEPIIPKLESESKITEVPVQSTVTGVSDLDMAKDTALGLETENTDKVVQEACVQNKDTEVSLHSVETETYVQKAEPEIQLQKLETEISLVNVEPEPHLLDTGAQIHAGKVETEIPIMEVEVEVEVHKQEVQTESLIQKVETKGHTEAVETKSHLQKVEAEVLVEKIEGKVDAEPASEMAKAESSTEKAEVEVPTKEAEAVVLTEKASTKGDMEVHTEKVDMEVHAEKEEAEGAQTKMALAAFMEQEDLAIPAKELEIPIQNAEAKVFKKTTDAVVHVETLTEESGANKEADVSAEKGKVEASSEKTAGKLDEQAHAEKVGVETHAEVAETAKKKAEGEVLVEKVVVEDSVEEAKMKSPVMKTATEASAERSEGMVEVETPITQGEPKEILQKVEAKVAIQTEMDDSLAKFVEVISADAPVHTFSEQASLVNVPMQRETQDVALSLESKHLEAVVSEVPLKNDLKDTTVAFEQTSAEQGVTQETGERRLDQVSVPSQDAVDLIQKDVTGARLILKSQQAEEIVPETPVPQELIILPMMTEMEVLKCMDAIASEDAMQQEKEDALILEAKSTEIQVTEDTVKKELGSIELATESKSTETVITEAAKTALQGGIHVLDSRCTQTVVSDAILENKGESAFPDLKAEGRETTTIEISGQTEPFPDKLETIHPLLESIPDLDSCQWRQASSEKTLEMVTEKSTENELACGDVLHTASVLQEIFTKQQEVVTTDIPEVQSYEVHKSSVAVTAAAVEEQVLSENVTFTETSAETLQSLLEQSKETSLNMVQQVSFAHSGLGAFGPNTKAKSWSEKAESTIEDPTFSARSTKDDLIQKCVSSIPEMKVQQSKSSPEAGKKVTSPERSPSLTHIEFEKDVVQSVTIESQSTKIVLKVIQNAVDKMEKTEEPESMLKQINEPCLMSLNKSEVQEGVPIDQQLPIKGIEEKNQEIQPSANILMQSAEKLETFQTTEEFPLSSDKCEDGEIWDSKKTDIDLESVKQTSQRDKQSCPVTTIMQEPGDLVETVKEIKKETGLKKENGKPKLESEVETQKAAVDGIVSRGLSKESLDADQPKLKGIEAWQTVQIHEQVVEQKTHVKRKEDHSQPVGFVESHTEKDVNNQDYTTCESQLKTELTES
ncbi:A-kinase anchor protein 12 isoform X2 [Tiliqua scincoides]|uniref:A-kinase anchor protein 12 isoform X2 n=1 Tax=Tiliqua scincoides TaxID=71010 RepID=UPI0034632400